MNILTMEQKAFVVKQFAIFRTPTEIVRLVRDNFDIVIARQSVAYYDPVHNKTLAAHWCEMFWMTRRKFLSMMTVIPLAHQAYRLQQLQDSLNRQLSRPNINETLLLDIIEQAAKEVGGIFTNHRVLSAKGAEVTSPLEMAKIVLRDLATEGVVDFEDAVNFVCERYEVPRHLLLDSWGGNLEDGRGSAL